jgi:uncharacterized membrane protein YdjX (TVP38/TMEM64 family)
MLALFALALAAQRAGLLGELDAHGLGRRAAELQRLAQQSPLAALGAYVLVYAIATGACLPVALLLTLSGGVVFGPWLGGAATVVGASCGAILTYLATRSAFAPSLVGRAQRDHRVRRVVEGFGRNAFGYVLAMRLIPFFPFPLVNIGAGLAAAPMPAYGLATVVGVVPSSMIYAGLGAGLGQSVRSPHALQAALHAPGVLLPLAGLSLLSLTPFAIQVWRSRAKPAA